MTDQRMLSVVNFIHQAIQRMELSTRLTAFLKFTLETGEDVVKGRTALSRRAHAMLPASPRGWIVGRCWPLMMDSWPLGLDVLPGLAFNIEL